ncbi:MAG TPA: hypothetical protein VMG09_08930 [Bacteroidota bacterium]|nr:hypothetical protein [Bacteroidota bacterium]
MNAKRIAPLLLLLIAVSCSPHRTEKALSHQKFARVYAILTKRGVSVRSPGVDTTNARKTADSILAAAGVTRDEMLATTQSISQSPAAWRKVMDEVSADMRDTTVR